MKFIKSLWLIWCRTVDHRIGKTDEDEPEILASNKESIEKNPNLILYPWAPLATNRDFYIRLEEVVTVYDPHGQVTEKYIELIEAKDGESKDSSS